MAEGKPGRLPDDPFSSLLSFDAVKCMMGDFGSGDNIDQSLKVKVKFTPKEATKAQKGSRGITIFFL